MPRRIEVLPTLHKGKQILIIKFKHDKDLIILFKAIPGAAWSGSLKSWYLPDTPANRKGFKIGEKSQAGKKVQLQINTENKSAFIRMKEELISRNYSTATRKTYLTEFSQLLYTLKETPVADMNYEQLRSYFIACFQEQKISANQLHSRINAVKFYFEKVLKQENFNIEIPRPKKPLLQPKLISPEAVVKLLSAAANLKHKLLLTLCYGMGLRVSEICALKVDDIDSDLMRVHIQGKKDHYVNLPVSILENLRGYYRLYRPKQYLFEGQFGDQYSIRSAQQVFTKCLERAGLNKEVGKNNLRHSFATHFLGNSTDAGIIQKLLGPNNIKTTLINTRVSDKTIAGIERLLNKTLRKTD